MKEDIKQNNYEFEEQFDKFLRGKMSPEEESNFKEYLKRNPELKQKAVATARIAKAMTAVGTAKDTETIKEINESNLSQIKNIADKASGKKTIRIIPFRKVIIAFSAAASIMLCIFGGYKYYQYSQTTGLGYESLSYYSSSEFTRGEDDEASKRLNSIYEALNKRENIASSIRQLEVMFEKSISEEYNDYTEYYPEIGWLLSNAYLMDNDRDKALKVLYKLRSDYDAETSLGESVRELIKKIEKI